MGDECAISDPPPKSKIYGLHGAYGLHVFKLSCFGDDLGHFEPLVYSQKAGILGPESGQKQHFAKHDVGPLLTPGDYQTCSLIGIQRRSVASMGILLVILAILRILNNPQMPTNISVDS